ncbi:UNKNOWN [Stylonychia lemnae]|uniref:Uncharacterized protein n=1 Tax=Stylonychia lemnae TaxID=5949 RepID=A0A078A060_STYLE|nr:UNKNOWN [Stylonychia lemnae]|eukprot:CDW74818.1 UNKNOWN [Stylonychia lemnae]
MLDQIKSGTNLSNVVTTPIKSSSKLPSHQNFQRDVIIHRTSNSVIVNDPYDFLKRKEEREKNISNKGWNAPTDRPYQQFGDFANVLQAIEGIKMNLPHTKGSLDQQTHKNIKIMKRINEVHGNYSNSSSNFAQQLIEPGRTVKILNQYQGQLRKFRASSQIGVIQSGLNNSTNNIQTTGQGTFNKKRYSNGDNHDKKFNVGQNDENEEEEDQQQQQNYTRLKNTRLHTNSLKRLISNSQDGGQILKSEIADSYQRVKAVKHGMLIKKDSEEIDKFKLLPIQKDAQSSTFITGLQEKPSIDLKPQSQIRSSKQSTASKTQPSSPSRTTNRKQLKFNTTANNNNTEDYGGYSMDSGNQPEQLIFIPNFHNKKAKIIRMSDLAKLKNQAYSTRQNNSGEGTVTIKARPNENGHSFQDFIGQSQNTYQSVNNNLLKKNQGAVNYHKKLQDEFERYDQIFREHYQITNKEVSLQQLTSNQQETPRGGQIINQIIQNQYIQKQSHGPSHHLSSNFGLNNLTVNTPKDGRYSRDESQHSDVNSPQYRNKRKPKKSTLLVKQNKQSDEVPTPLLLNKNSKVNQSKKVGQNNQTSTISNQGSTNQSRIYPRSFEQRLSKQERENILISSITNSIKCSNEQEEMKLLDMLTEDQLFKECSQLLKEYFNINFLNELKENKLLIFRLYKLYLLHSLSMNIKQIDDNQNQANNIMYFKRHQRSNQNGLIEEVVSIASDSSDEDQNYRGESGTGAFKQKMNGFIRLLQEILSPAEKESLELDSVFQLKSLVKSYYEKKGNLAENLTETLYAMMCERPQILDAKKRNFFKSYEDPTQGADVKKIRNLYFELEQMRLKAERERLTNYKEMIENLLTNHQSPVKKVY